MNLKSVPETKKTPTPQNLKKYDQVFFWRSLGLGIGQAWKGLAWLRFACGGKNLEAWALPWKEN